MAAACALSVQAGEEFPGLACCECGRSDHDAHDDEIRCDKELKWQNRGRDRLDWWEANHRIRVEDGGDASLENCEIVCWECHRQIQESDDSSP